MSSPGSAHRVDDHNIFSKITLDLLLEKEFKCWQWTFLQIFFLNVLSAVFWYKKKNWLGLGKYHILAYLTVAADVAGNRPDVSGFSADVLSNAGLSSCSRLRWFRHWRPPPRPEKKTYCRQKIAENVKIATLQLVRPVGSRPCRNTKHAWGITMIQWKIKTPQRNEVTIN